MKIQFRKAKDCIIFYKLKNVHICSDDDSAVVELDDRI